MIATTVVSPYLAPAAPPGGHGQRNNSRALGEAIVGGIVGGMIANGGYPPYPVVPVPIPVPAYGYNGVGGDGVYLHFDPYGNVADASGHYRLIQDQWGNCYRTAPSPY